jgi:hypothetical protein
MNKAQKKAHWNVPAYEGSLSRRIRILVSENPKEAGSDSSVRFDQYRAGMTIQEYIDACDKLNVPNYALSDITWDAERHFIALDD